MPSAFAVSVRLKSCCLSAAKIACRSISSSRSSSAASGGVGAFGGVAHARRQMIRQNQFALGKQHRPLHRVAQLAHVARPSVILQARHRRLGQPRAAPGKFRQEQVRQRQNVLAPLAQRPDIQLHHVQPVKQILAETPGLHLLLQVPVARGEDADVRAHLAVGADALERSILRHAQHLGLKRRRHLGDFIEKNRSAVGLLEPPDALRRRAGERAFFVAEQFGSPAAFSGMAAQLTLISGPAARELHA